MNTNTTYTTTNTVGSTNISKTNGVVKSRSRTSFKEFALKKELRPEVQAGFKVWLRDDLFFFDDEWERKYDEYCNRGKRRK